MARVTVKLFGVLRVDSGLQASDINADKLGEVFGFLNDEIGRIYERRLKDNPALEKPGKINFSDTVVYINGKRCPKKSRRLADGDEIWLMSPASGG